MSYSPKEKADKIKAKEALIKLIKDEICGFDSNVATAALIEVLCDTWYSQAKEDVVKKGLADLVKLSKSIVWAQVSVHMNAAIDHVCQQRALDELLSGLGE